MPPLPITQNVQLEDVLNVAQNLQMSPDQTIEFLSGALDLARRPGRRVFSYTDPVDAEQPDCRGSFSRSFQHSDWIDGESVVQAGQTTLEDGFNARFHRIEADLDSLSRDIGHAFTCLAAQRREVARALEELKTEINRINSDVHECCNGGRDPVRPYPDFPYRPMPYPRPMPMPMPMPMPRPDVPDLGPRVPGDPRPGPLANPGGFGIAGQPWLDPRGSGDPVRDFVDAVGGRGGFAAPGAAVLRSSADPGQGVIAGMPARLLEESSFNGRPVEVWSTALGLILTPRVEGETNEAGRANWVNPRIGATGRFAKWAAGKEAEVKRELGAEFTLGDFAKKFGDETVEGGMRVADLIDPLAADTKAKSPLDLVAPLAEASGKEIVREGFAAETVIGAVGLNAGAAPVAEAAVGSLKTLDKDAADRIAGAGISTVGALADAPIGDLTKILKRGNSEFALERAAEMKANAAAVVAVDRNARGRGRFGG